KFQKILKMSDFGVNTISNLKKVKGQYSEFLLQDSYGERLFRVRVTPEEYLRFSSSKDDNSKINLLIKNVPNLSLSEAIRCLSF
ncbi:MAG: hypothetical protein KDD37_09610, partial [Bdellovibrionales bacterium]|nr:hypothetical protein [Bdellovibrionales bacterium]